MSVGIDIIKIERIKKIGAQRLADKILSDAEKPFFRPDKSESLAAAFAAKEAFSKALGTGMRGFDFRDISLMHDALGKPYIVMSDKLSAIVSSRGLSNCEVSLTHEKDYAVAAVTMSFDSRFALYERAMQKLTDAADEVINPDYIRTVIKPRRRDMHKGDCGRLFSVAGSTGLTGAAIMSANSALRCGAGLVTLGCPRSLNTIFEMRLTEAMTLPLADTDGIINTADSEKILSRARKADCVLFGPGLGHNRDTEELARNLLENCESPIVADADGINSVSVNTDILREHKSVILTPHVGEFARLCKKEISDILSHTAEYAKKFAREYGVVLVLKSHETVVASPDGRLMTNRLGNPGMATGGSGDVLSGAIASFVCQGFPQFDAAAAGVYVHSLAADMAAQEMGEYGLLPTDIISYLPYAVKYSIGS